MRAPDFERGLTRIWRLADTAKSEPDHEAGIATWVIDSPTFHPAWHQWLLGVISLRDLPGVPPAHRSYPSAEYELMILSLNPDRPCDVDQADATGTWGDEAVAKFLTPADLVYQFDGVSDRQADEVGQSAIQAILSGDLSPDSDFRRHWERALDDTVAHFKAGLHS